MAAEDTIQHLDPEIDSDEEEEDNEASNFGYVSLTQNVLAETDDEEDEPDEPEPATTMFISGSQTSAPVFVVDRNLASMSKADEELVRATMASFVIPPSAQPEWAKLIDEKAWLPKVVYRDEQPQVVEDLTETDR